MTYMTEKSELFCFMRYNIFLEMGFWKWVWSEGIIVVVRRTDVSGYLTQYSWVFEFWKRILNLGQANDDYGQVKLAQTLIRKNSSTSVQSAGLKEARCSISERVLNVCHRFTFFLETWSWKFFCRCRENNKIASNANQRMCHYQSIVFVVKVC